MIVLTALIALPCTAPAASASSVLVGTPGTSTDTTATYECLAGYSPAAKSEVSISGQRATITCTNRDAGQPLTAAYPPAPVCNANVCQLLAAPENGLVDNQSSQQQTATPTGNFASFSCNPGYSIAGSASPQCVGVSGPTPEWNTGAPTCEPDSCTGTLALSASGLCTT